MAYRFSVIEARVARMVSERFAAETGFLVVDHAARIIHRMKRKSDAVAACGRLNDADLKRLQSKGWENAQAIMAKHDKAAKP